MKFHLAAALALASCFAVVRAEICEEVDPDACIKGGKPCTNREDDCCGELECLGFNFFKTCKERPDCLPEWHDCSAGVGCCGDLVCAETTGGLFECTKEVIGTRTVEITPGGLIDEPPVEPKEEEEPPNLKTTKKLSNDIVGACVTGDPHIKTFDCLLYDCQGIGEFILLKSKITRRLAQGRFKQMTERPVSGMHALVVQDEGDSSKVQINVRETDSIAEPFGSHNCMIQLHVNGVQHSLFEEKNANGFAYEDESVSIDTSKYAIKVQYKESELTVVVNIRGGDLCALAGCFFMPENDDELVGLLGSANKKTDDDWMKRDGTIIKTKQERRGEVPYNYCTDNWCMTNPDDSIFTYHEEGFDFETYERCDHPEGTMLVEEIEEKLTEEEEEACGGNIACMEDTVNVGAETGKDTLKDLAELEEKTTRKADIGADCQKNTDCGSSLCFKNGWAGDRCVPKDFKIKQIKVMKEEGGLCCDDLPCGEEMQCTMRKSKDKYGTCHKVEKCGKRGKICSDDEDCCGSCLETTEKNKAGRPIKRCKVTTKTAKAVCLANGESCEKGKGLGCCGDNKCIKDGNAGFKCIKVPKCWNQKGKNCNPNEGMPGCCDGFVCMKTRMKGFQNHGSGSGSDDSGDDSGSNDGGNTSNKYKYVCQKKATCAIKAGECGLPDGSELPCCDKNRKCVKNKRGKKVCQKIVRATELSGSNDGSNDGSNSNDGNSNDGNSDDGNGGGDGYCFLSNMYNAGDPKKRLVAKSYKKMDCARKTLCFKVMAESGIYISSKENWYKDYDMGNSEVKPLGKGIELVKDKKGHAVGWKGCFSVNNVKTASAELHANWGRQTNKCGYTASTGKKKSGTLKATFCTGDTGSCSATDTETTTRTASVIPKPDKCLLKRGKGLLEYKPDFPQGRPDVYIEVETGNGKNYKFYPSKYPKYKGGVIPITDKNVFNILLKEQEKNGGKGFKMRYVSKNGAGEWNSCKYSPIALDINNSGEVEHIQSDAGFEIDITGDGDMEHLREWFAPTEGILIDANNGAGEDDYEDGIITGHHLMGDMGGKYTDGFDKLSTYDDNDDGKISGDELIGLYIWVDSNSNMVIDEGEEKELSEYNIVALSTTHDDLKSYAELKDGGKMLMEDLWFNPFRRQR